MSRRWITSNVRSSIVNRSPPGGDVDDSAGASRRASTCGDCRISSPAAGPQKLIERCDRPRKYQIAAADVAPASSSMPRMMSRELSVESREPAAGASASGLTIEILALDSGLWTLDSTLSRIVHYTGGSMRQYPQAHTSNSGYGHQGIR